MNWNIEEITGYKPITTFYTDFSFADVFGVSAIKDTFKRVHNEWHIDVKYYTELVMVLNWKLWHYYERGNMTLADVYNELYEEASSYAETHFTGKDLMYYYHTTD